MQAMRLLIVSDLHNECIELRNSWPDSAKYDVVILAGDIHSGINSLSWALQNWPDKPVIFVPGNHEFDNLVLVETRAAMREFAGQHSNLILLDDDVVMHDGVRFVGGTLWTDFRLFSEDETVIREAMGKAERELFRYERIRYDRHHGLLPQDTVTLHHRTRYLIQSALAKPFPGQTVVVTHFLPSHRSVSTRFAADPLTPAFASALDDLAAKADFWIHGHAHHSVDYRIGRCRVICNPRGYARPDGRLENRAFSAGFIIDTLADSTRY